MLVNTCVCVGVCVSACVYERVRMSVCMCVFCATFPQLHYSSREESILISD